MSNTSYHLALGACWLTEICCSVPIIKLSPHFNGLTVILLLSNNSVHCGQLTYLERIPLLCSEWQFPLRYNRVPWDTYFTCLKAAPEDPCGKHTGRAIPSALSIQRCFPQKLLKKTMITFHTSSGKTENRIKIL